MSRRQLMDMYQRQVDLGGAMVGGALVGGMSTGGAFKGNLNAMAGLAAYREWHSEYKYEHPYATREELKEAWRAHKSGIAYAAPLRVSKLRKPPQNIRHCVEPFVGPKGSRRCKKYALGPRPAGSALVGGYPGEGDLRKGYYDTHGCSPGVLKARRALFKEAKQAYEHETNATGEFKKGVMAAAAVLGQTAPDSWLASLKRRSPPSDAQKARRNAAARARRLAKKEAAPPPKAPLSEEEIAQAMFELGIEE